MSLKTTQSFASGVLLLVCPALAAVAAYYWVQMFEVELKQAGAYAAASTQVNASQVKITASEAAESVKQGSKAEQIIPNNEDKKQALRINQMWEANAQKPPTLLDQPLTAPNWTINGVVQQADTAQIVVQVQGDPQIKFFKVGDKLPGGSTLSWVRPGLMAVITPEKKTIEIPVLLSSNPELKTDAPVKLPRAAPMQKTALSPSQ
jgi:hypothetical protein